LANAAGFDVLVTADKNIHFQQNFDGLHLSAVVIPSNRKILVQKSVFALLQSLERLTPGSRCNFKPCKRRASTQLTCSACRAKDFPKRRLLTPPEQ
jgi:hypothetical protein